VSTTQTVSSSLKDISTLSTVLDAAMALTRKEYWSAAFLFVAAALSRRVPWLGTVASVLVRLARRRR